MSDKLISIKILKGLDEHLHCAMRDQRKVTRGKKKHDFNFKSRVEKGFQGTLLGLLGSEEYGLRITKWSQDMKRYYHQWSMQVVARLDTSTLNTLIVNKRGNETSTFAFELANPKCFDFITDLLIKHLDWRG